MPDQPTIILLEDDDQLRDLVADGLQHAGYQVIALADPDALTGELEALGGDAILFADRKLGAEGPNGFDAAHAALQRFDALRVIYCSGTQIALKRRALSARERGLLKPFALSQLLSLVRQLHPAAFAGQSRGND